LAAVLAQARQWAEAEKTLSTGIPAEFAGLAADRLGDIYSAQGKKAEAQAAYDKALKAIPEDQNYRRLVQLKRDSVSSMVALPAQAAASAATAGASAAAGSASAPAAAAPAPAPALAIPVPAAKLKP
jgi:tetratricopeptide (TPR) repeat protein